MLSEWFASFDIAHSVFTIITFSIYIVIYYSEFAFFKFGCYESWYSIIRICQRDTAIMASRSMSASHLVCTDLNPLENSSPMIENSVTRTSHRHRCKMRCFYSKRALLVLFWFSLVAAIFWSLTRLCTTLFRELGKNTVLFDAVVYIPLALLIVLAPLIGWLADVYFGSYKVFKTGLILVFQAAILSCVCILILMNVDESSAVSLVVSVGVSPVVCSFGLAGVVACCVTAIQLGLDQMPDASSANIASFVNWFVFSLFAGVWVSNTIYFVTWECVYKPAGENWNIQLFSLLPAACSCISCCSFFLLAPKWLIIEPKCPQSLKTIYQVLEFAAKHKAPLNRSALTYWEEDIPSRVDLGKSRYGGPFTTEQVEDVKTFFKIAVMFLSFAVILVSVSPRDNVEWRTKFAIPGFSCCKSEVVYTFTFSSWWCSIVTMVIFELVVHPLLQYRFPGILKCIGIASFLALLSNTGILIVTVIDLCYSLGLSMWLGNTYKIIVGIFLPFILAKLYEFVCAQSPYNMRGLLAGYMFLVAMFAIGTGANVLNLSVNSLCHGHYCLVIENSITVALSLIGFILYCVLARWYKRRVRDEEYDAHRVVEEVYDRYLSH